MSLDFLTRITENIVKNWNRSDLNKKFVDMAKELLVSKEKNIQDAKKIAELEDENRRLKAEKERPKFKKKIKGRTTKEAKSNTVVDTPKSQKKTLYPWTKPQP